MKNILVLKHYTLNSVSGWNPIYRTIDSTVESIKPIRPRLLLRYEHMKEMCIASAKKFICGLDDIIVHTGEVNNIQSAFKQHFYDLYDLWKQKDVNILYADLDVLFIREFDWFNQSSGFMMYDGGNSGLRYYGHDMNEELWNHAFDRCKFWPNDKWDYEQDIYKSMLSHPLNYDTPKQCHGLVLNNPSNLEFMNTEPNYKAVHFHSSNGDDNINRMVDLYNLVIEKETQ